MTTLTVLPAIIDSNEHGCVCVGTTDSGGFFLEPEAAAHIAGLMIGAAMVAGKRPGKGRDSVSLMAILRAVLRGTGEGQAQSPLRDPTLSDRINARTQAEE